MLAPPVPAFNIDKQPKQGHHHHQHDLIKACIWHQDICQKMQYISD